MKKIRGSIIKGHGQRILIADDENLLAASMMEYLKSINYRCETVNDGSDVVEKYFSWRPHLVILDRNMPNVNGIAAAQSILERDSRARIIMMSGFDKFGPDGLPPSLQRLIKAYITKPFELAKISATIALALSD